MTAINKFIDRFFLPFLLAAYFVAGAAPQLGLRLAHLHIFQTQVLGEHVQVTLSMMMLAGLLFIASLSSKVSELAALPAKFGVMAAGLASTVFLPVLLVTILSTVLSHWHSNDELQNLLVGLALIAGMPIAGSSAAWTQNSGGNGGLSLGMIVLSIVISPLAAPFTLTVFQHLTNGDYSEDLGEMANQGTNLFLWLTVVLPSVLGVVLKLILGEKRVEPVKPTLKFISLITLISINYINGSKALPSVFKNPDVDFIVFVGLVTCLISALSFAAGLGLARLFKCPRADTLALVFCLGMSNTGTGMVLATGALADHPGVLLPMIFYTLVQQALAGFIYTYLSRAHEKADRDEALAARQQ